MLSAGTRAVAALSVVSLVLAVAVTAATGDRLAVAMLFAAVVAFVALAGGVVASSGVGDRGVLVGASGAPRPVSNPSFAPLLVALGGGVLVLGAALGVVAYAFGGALLAFGGLVWFSSAWREHPLHVPKISARVSDSFSMPFGLPLAVMALIGVVAISLSRALLATSKMGSVWVALLVAVVFLVGGVVAAVVPKRTSRATFVAVVALFLVAIVAIGIAGLAKGERKFGEHHGEKLGEKLGEKHGEEKTEQVGTPEA